MKLKKKSIIGLVAILPVLFFLWPTHLYGNTSYIMLLGNSMYPNIESGTLIIVQPDEQYLLGDIIAFVNEDNVNVVHRIVEETDEGFVTKGDNNPKNDEEAVPYDEVLGRAKFIIPYVGFTSLFLKSPLGMAIFGVWVLILVLPKKPRKEKVGEGHIFKIFHVALGANVVSYVMTQVALGIDIKSSEIMNIPLANFLELSTASTISFALFFSVIVAFYFFVRNIESTKPKGGDKIKLIFAASGTMILVIQIMNIINLLPIFLT